MRGHSSIDGPVAGAWEVSVWSTRSAASMNDVDTDKRRLIMGRRGMVSRFLGLRAGSSGRRPSRVVVAEAVGAVDVGAGGGSGQGVEPGLAQCRFRPAGRAGVDAGLSCRP